MRKKLLLAAVVLILLLAGCGPSATSSTPALTALPTVAPVKTSPPEPATTTTPAVTPEPTRRLDERVESGAGYRQDEEGVVVVHLRGSEAEMQAQYRALLADEIEGFHQAAASHRVMRRFSDGCTNFAAFGPASADGKLWHARNFDFSGHGVLDRYRVVYIVEPADKIPFVAVGCSADHWNHQVVHTAMNAQGLSLGYMLSVAPGESIMDTPTLWALFRRVIENASTIEEALAILEAGPRRGAANLLLADGKVPDAVVVELTSDALAVRWAEDGVVYSTNHFVSPEMFYPENKDPDTYARFERLGELGSLHYGAFDLKQTVAVLRDRYDVHAGRESLGGDIIATPSNMLSVVFCPSDLTFWVANGLAPAAYREFVGFSLQDELDGTQAHTSVPSVPADPIVGSAAWAEMEAFQGGYLAYLQSDDTGAAERLAEAVSLNPHSARYGYYLGVSLANLGHEEEAIAAFEAALAGDPHNGYCAYIYYRLGLIYEALGAEEKMRAAFEQVLALDVGDEEIEGYARQALDSPALETQCLRGEIMSDVSDKTDYQTHQSRKARGYLWWTGRILGGLIVLALVSAGALVVYRTIHPLDEGMTRQSMYLTMRDGVKIAIDLYLPEGLMEEERLPTILQQTRYFRSYKFRWPFGLFFPSDSYNALGIRKRFVTHGYAWVSVDVRGTGASYGYRMGPYPSEQIKDSAEIVDWIIRQSWSNGKVGAYGISYDATCAELLLVNKPPAVKAIAPTFEGFDLYTDIASPGGVPHEWFFKFWGTGSKALDRNALHELVDWPMNLLINGVRPVDADRDHSMLAEAIRDHAYNWDVYETSLRFTYRDDVLSYDWNWNFDGFSPHTYVKEIEASGAAIYSYSGWFDGAYPHAAIKRFLTLNNPGSKLIIGPWDHIGLHNLSPTIRDEAKFDHVAELLRFFDYHLKGIDTGIMDEEPVRYYTMVEDKWKFADAWPPPEAIPVTYYLAQGNVLSRDKPSVAEEYDTYRVDYSAGTGDFTRWKALSGGIPDANAYPDRNEQDKKLLTYTSAPLDQEMEITGHPIATLYVSSTATDGNSFVYLEDVDEQGHVTYVTEGQLRAIHRKLSDEEPPYQDVVPYRTFKREDAMPLVPGEITELVFDLIPTSYLFKEGHSIRIAIAGADKDHFFIPPGEPPALRFYRNSVHASRINLPVIPRE